VSQTPITYTQTIYPFGEPGIIQSNDWVLWDSDASNPLTISFDSNLSVMSIWIPQLTGPVTFYSGDTPTGTPFYVSGGAGSELVPIPVDTLDVTMVGSGGDMYVYYTSLVLDPFRQGVIGNQVTAVTATLPILSSGGTQPNISLQVPLAIGYGGTGTATPVGVYALSGFGIIVTGSFPDQALSLDFGGLGVVTAVTATSPLSSTGGTTPNIALTGVVPLGNGGTNQTDPGWTNTAPLGGATPGAGIHIGGTIFDPGSWTFTNVGVTSLETDDSSIDVGDLRITGAGGISTSTTGAKIIIDGSGISGGFAKQLQVTGTNPSGTLSILLPSGTWVVEALVSGLSANEVASAGTCTVTLSSGSVDGWDSSQYNRTAAASDIVTSAGSTTITATLTCTGGGSGDITVNSHATSGFFVLRATPKAT
jgi:hypothetical protein